jgi:hypothetical protein
LLISGARCWGSGETVVGDPLVRREQSEALEAGFDRSESPSVLACDLDERIAGLERADQISLLIRRPGSSNIVRQLRAAQCACGDLLEGGDTRQQRAYDFRSLQHRPCFEIRARRRIDSLDKSLKYLPCSLFLHDRTIHG